MSNDQQRDSDETDGITRRGFVTSAAAVGGGMALPSFATEDATAGPGTGWDSVALFFNLSGSNTPGGYSHTSVADAKEWLDEGSNPASPTISEWMENYFETLSYGTLSFGIDTPRDSSGDPIVPTFPASSVDNFHEGINQWLDHDAEAIWKAAGKRWKNGDRFIPSVVLVENYNTNASANYGGFSRTINGIDYRIGDRTHIEYGLSFVSGTQQRKFWSTLAHEFGHNFLEAPDLYGPEGSVGYRDLMADWCSTDAMSEVTSATKADAGWLSFNEVAEGPYYGQTSFTLDPYTTSGDAIKAVPDPKNNPHEYFVLEYRRSTGSDSWQPDRALDEDGLCITHINERLGKPNNWLLRNAPLFDGEDASANDDSITGRHGRSKLEETLYPAGENDAFTPYSTPSSDFYGGRRSELYVENIRTTTEFRSYTGPNGRHFYISSPVVKFDLTIQRPEGSRAWSADRDDRGVSGRFTSSDQTDPDEVFFRNDGEAALLTRSDAQWFVEDHHDGRVGGWALGDDDRELVGDLDGDGRDEIYIRSDNWVGVIEWDDDELDTRLVTKDWIYARDIDDMAGWDLRAQDREYIGDFDGDGTDEVYVRSNNWAGILTLEGSYLDNEAIHHDRIGEWDLRAQDISFVGQFSRTDRDEIMVRSNEWIGLLYYDDSAKRMRCENLQHDWVDSWNLGETDRHVVGDFDGDGYDEIFIRGEGGWSGVLEWQNGAFDLKWINHGDIDYHGANGSFTPEQSDYYDAGTFLPDPVWSGQSSLSHKPDRDGVLAVKDGADKPLNILTWEEGEMKARFQTFGGHMNWQDDNGFIIGDFHPIEPDRDDPTKDFVRNGGADIFVHNAWGTGTFGINYVEFNPQGKPGSINEDAGITWKQEDYLVSLE